MLFMFTACGGENEPPVGTGTEGTGSQDSESTENTEPGNETVAPTKVADYVMILPDNMTKFQTETANTLFSRLEKRTGAEIEYEEDNYNEDQPERYELVIGNVRRAAAAEALSKLALNEYGIFVSDYKITIIGWTDYTTRMALMYFEEMITDITVQGEDGTYYFTFAETEYVKTYDKYAGDIPAFDGELIGAYDCADDCIALWYEKVDATSFDTYTATVKAEGYTLANENMIGANKYATYVKDAKKLHFYYIDSEKELRIVAGANDLNTSLMIPKDQQPAATVTPSVTLMPMRYISAAGGGACMVYLLEDGTFFVIDGGWKEEAEVLYKTLCALNEDANGKDAPIVISAWFISHGHGDHTGCIYTFATTYGSKVKLNAVIGNDIHLAQSADATTSTATGLNSGKLKSGVLRYFADVNGKTPKLMKLHTGQKLSFGGMEIDVLFTHEDMFDTKVTNYNDFNTVLRVELGGHRFILANDATRKEIPKIAEEIAKEELEAEFCMVTHHGADSGHMALYRAVEAKYYFWPNSKEHYDRDILQNKYEYCLYVVENATEIYLADTYCNTLVLPYAEGEVLKWLPDTEKPSDVVTNFKATTTPSYGETVAWKDGIQ